MPHGTCDPSPNAFHTTVLAKDNARVIFTVRWSWDGVSIYPDCAGPIQDVRLQNKGPNLWRLSLPNSQFLKTRDVPPGTDRTFSGAQLAGIGLITVADIEGVQMTLVTG